MKEASPLQILRSNAESKRKAARAFRLDADNLIYRADQMDAEALVWEKAAEALEGALSEK